MNLRWWTDRESVGATGLLGFMVSYGGGGPGVSGRGELVVWREWWRVCACVRAIEAMNDDDVGWRRLGGPRLMSV